jgi:C4-dicarboxylate-specific signal transduction histidine kinase
MAQIITTLRGVFTESGAQMQRVDLFEVINGLDLLIQPQARKRGITLEYQIFPDCFVDVKFSEIQQVLLNLVGNAFDALVNYKPAKPQVVIQLYKTNDYVVCCIEDNGPGISEEEQDNMFKFLKTSKADGMGLGLWLSKYIIGRCHGEIGVTRSQIGGAAFQIKLPNSKHPAH